MHEFLVVDSSVLISLNGKEGKLETYLRRRKSEDYIVVMTQAIVKEVIDEPKKFACEIKAASPVLANNVLASVSGLALPLNWD